jgi:trimethylamine--corrinoid protein Co-methyltransferase
LEFTVITAAEIERIHDASCRILSTAGVQVPHDEMRRLFGSAGAEVDERSERVKIPEKLILDCLDKAGKEFTIYGRDRSI